MPTFHRGSGRRSGWRRRLTAGAVAAALLPSSAAGAAPPRGRAAELELYWHDASSALPFPHRLVGRRVSDAFALLGIAARWIGAEPNLVTTGRALRVVLLAEDRSPRTRQGGVIGAVRRDPKARTVWVILPNVERALGLEHSGPSRRAVEDAQLAHALARVVVHEVFHLVLPKLPHTPGSLMQAHFGREDLLAPIRLAPELGAVMAAALLDERSSSTVASRAAREAPAVGAVPTLP